MEHEETTWDVVVVGGGSAGLNAALTLSRARRSVLVIDAGDPRNAPADGVHNYLGAEGTPPAELLARGRAEVEGYGGVVVAGRAVGAERADDGRLVVHRADAAPVTARRLLVTTGVADELPAVDGLRERWGRDVLHCPYCHGWEVRDRAVVVLGSGPMAVHQSELLRQWSADVTLVVHTAPAPTADELRALAARGIAVVDGEADALEVTADRLTGLRMLDGRVVPADALVVGPRAVARSEVLDALGVATVDVVIGEHSIGTVAVAEPSGATAVPGVWVAGNVADLRASVIGAAGAGFSVATMINLDLVEDDVARAVAAADAAHHGEGQGEGQGEGGQGHGHGHGHRNGMPETEGRTAEEFWEELYGQNPQRWSGRVNPVLAEVAAAERPGRALDLGCGEGGDTVWLAGQGWDVTGVDVSATALARARAAADETGVGERVRLERHDLAESLPAGTFDLVSAQFLQSPLLFPRSEVLGRLAGSIAAGGLLLLVDHGSAPSWSWADPDTRFPEPAEVRDALGLDPSQWSAERLDTPTRDVTGPAGERGTVVDTVVALRRVGAER